MLVVRLMVYASLSFSSVFYKNVLYPESYVELHYHFGVISDILKRRKIVLKQNQSKIIYAIVHTILLVYMIYSVDIYDSLYPTAFMIIINWPHFNYLSEGIVAWNMLENVREYFIILNNAIINLQSCEMMKNQLKINDLIEIHENLLKILKSYNKIFGISVVFRNLIFVVEVLFTSLKLVTIPGAGIYLDLFDCLVDMVN